MVRHILCDNHMISDPFSCIAERNPLDRDGCEISYRYWKLVYIAPQHDVRERVGEQYEDFTLRTSKSPIRYRRATSSLSATASISISKSGESRSYVSRLLYPQVHRFRCVKCTNRLAQSHILSKQCSVPNDLRNFPNPTHHTQIQITCVQHSGASGQAFNPNISSSCEHPRTYTDRAQSFRFPLINLRG